MIKKMIKAAWYSPLLNFGLHIIGAMIIFSLIAFSAFMLHVMIHWMDLNGLDTPLLYILKAVTYLILFVDVLVFLVHTYSETKDLLKEILK